MPSASNHPSPQRQGERLSATIERLPHAFEQTTTVVTDSSAGIDPEKVLFLKIKGTVDNFEAILKKLGFEWLGEKERDDLAPDEDFYEDEGKTKSLKGQLFLTMTNRQCLEKMIAFWQRFVAGSPLPYGYTKLKLLFCHLEEVSFWGPKQRLEYHNFHNTLEDTLAFDENQDFTFLIEFWFRPNLEQRQTCEVQAKRLLSSLHGRVITTYANEEIAFHAMMVRAPATSVRALINDTFNQDKASIGNDILHYDGIMYFSAPSAFHTTQSLENRKGFISFDDPPKGPVRVALLDGYPFLAHQSLSEWVELDDPDHLIEHYQASQMIHGTAMASMILHGDLNNPARRSLNSNLYLRPVMIPDPQLTDHPETLYPDRFPEDLIERAVVRMFESTEQSVAVAPHVKVINLSLGDLNRPFLKDMSSWARLIDSLSWRYQVLFIISAGNQIQPLSLGDPSSFQQLDDSIKRQHTLSYFFQERLERRILSPAEAINAICVGASHSDHTPSENIYMGSRVDILPSNPRLLNTFPSPVSPIGGGLRNAMKPEILFPGGRQLYSEPISSNEPFRISKSALPPGVLAASPGQKLDETNRFGSSCGTSNAAALATHAAGHLLETLDLVRESKGGEQIEEHHVSSVLKAMLVHGAQWPPDAANEFWQAKTENVSSRAKKFWTESYLGYGNVDLERVVTCTNQRATLVGAGSIDSREPVHQFDLPLPQQFDGFDRFRRLTITLAWFSPINPNHRQYYRAKLSLELPQKCSPYKRGGKTRAKTPITKPGVKSFFDTRHTNRGTVQHMVLEGRSIIDVGPEDFIPILVKLSKSNAGGAEAYEPIHYGLVVSLEVAANETFPIYEAVRQALTTTLPIETQV